MGEKITSNKKYTYNETNKKYVFHTEKKFGKNYVFTSYAIDNIIRLYSNFDDHPATMQEIGKKMSIPTQIVKFVLNAMNITHDSLPYSDEKVDVVEEDDLVTDALQFKRFNVLQKFEKKDWKETEEDAEKWREFSALKLNPFESFIENWTPPKYSAKQYTYPKNNSNKELLIGASDWHFGLYAHERYLYNQKEWNIEETKKSVESYAKQLQAHIKGNSYSKLNVLFLGDLAHTLSGFTDKGTKLEANPIGEEQLEVAFNSMVNFIEELLAVHNNIMVYACSGNHSSMGDYILVKMLSLYFKTDKRIKFTITNKRHITFKVFNNLFLMEHGYSAVSRDRLPAAGKARETYINNLFLAKPDQLSNISNRYYLSADQHHLETYELTNVEGYMFPTLVGGCRHSDNSGYKSRPRQLCLSVDAKGIKEVINFYFD